MTQPCPHDWRTVATVTRHVQTCATCQQQRTVSARPPCPDDIGLDQHALTEEQRRENVALTVQAEQERRQVDAVPPGPHDLMARYRAEQQQRRAEVLALSPKLRTELEMLAVVATRHHISTDRGRELLGYTPSEFRTAMRYWDEAHQYQAP